LDINVRVKGNKQLTIDNAQMMEDSASYIIIVDVVVVAKHADGRIEPILKFFCEHSTQNPENKRNHKNKCSETMEILLCVWKWTQ
jgi:hypothetical protein